MPSPLATLTAILAQTCLTASQHKQLLSKNEAATRAVLIDPVLRALGWDTTNLLMVEPERTVENKQSLDYVLKGSMGNIQSVIEAKKLGESLDKLGHVGALIGYAFSLKPVSFFITDGLNWHCYSPEYSHYKPIATIELLTDNLLPAALQLIQFLDAAHSGHGLVTQPIEVAASPAVPLPISKSNKAVLPPILSKKYLPLALDLVHLTEPSSKPTWLRLPDGTEHQIKNWKDILIKTADLVLDACPNLPVPLPDKAGKKTALLRWVCPAMGLSYKAITYQGKPAFLYTNYSAAVCVANAIYLLALLPKSKQVAEAGISFQP
ncbi:MAG: hypothetical protein EOO60_09030 [Hymenobacter sp.]|nr:MAG: hypothetical protein EOO60_09030 [Hymenobacter sp.]